MKKMIVYLDLDGVLVDFKAGLFSAALIHQSSPYRMSTEKDIDDLIFATPDFYEKLPAIPGAVEAAKTLFKDFDVYFLSTPMWDVPNSWSAKRMWVEKHFGELATKKLILTHRKDLVMGDYLVDDRTKHGAGEFTGVHIHFGQPGFETWDKVLDYFKSVKEVSDVLRA